jgi:hypothetical protein
MLIIVLVIWIILLTFVVALCRVAASADDPELTFPPQLPVGSTTGVRTVAGGLVVWEEETGRDRLMGTATALRHAGRFAARP